MTMKSKRIKHDPGNLAPVTSEGNLPGLHGVSATQRLGTLQFYKLGDGSTAAVMILSGMPWMAYVYDAERGVWMGFWLDKEQQRSKAYQINHQTKRAPPSRQLSYTVKDED